MALCELILRSERRDSLSFCAFDFIHLHSHISAASKCKSTWWNCYEHESFRIRDAPRRLNENKHLGILHVIYSSCRSCGYGWASYLWLLCALACRIAYISAALVSVAEQWIRVWSLANSVRIEWKLIQVISCKYLFISEVVMNHCVFGVICIILDLQLLFEIHFFCFAITFGVLSEYLGLSD